MSVIPEHSLDVMKGIRIEAQSVCVTDEKIKASGFVPVSNAFY